MAMLADLRFDASGILHDLISEAVGTQDGSPQHALVYQKTIDELDLYVSGDKWGRSDQSDFYGYGNIIALPSFDSLTVWSISFWIRASWSQLGALLLQNTGGWHPRFSGGATFDQLLGPGCDVSMGWGWGELLFRANGSHAEVLWNGTVIYTIEDNAVTLEGGSYRIGSFSPDYAAGVDIARVTFHDSYVEPRNLASLPGINAAIGPDAFSGMSAREEADGSNLSRIYFTGQDSFDIAFPGTVCWGAMMGNYGPTPRIRLSGRVRYDSFVESSGHISNTLQVVGLYANNDRSAPIACIHGVFNFETDTIDAVRFSTEGGGTQEVQLPILANTDYDWSLLKTGSTVVFTWAGVDYTFTDVDETDDTFMLGGNLGVHLGSVETPWEAHYSNIEYVLGDEPVTGHTVTFDANGASSGTPPVPVVVDDGASTALPANTGNLKREGGYIITGWRTGPDSGDVYLFGSDYSPTADTTLYAYWDMEADVTAKASNGQSISFNAEGDEFVDGQVVYIEKIRVIGNADTAAGAEVEIRCAPYNDDDVIFRAVATGAYYDKESSFTRLYGKSGIKATKLDANLIVDITKKL